MPPIRKVDRLPSEIMDWLKAELQARGFSDYVEVADLLNAKLADAGVDLTIGKSALAEFGAGHKAFVELQKESSKWAESWTAEAGLEDVITRHSVLFQMLTALAFKLMKSQLEDEDTAPDAKELHFVGRMMKDVMGSTEMVQKMEAAHAKKLDAKLTEAVAKGDVDEAAAEAARRAMGFAA